MTDDDPALSVIATCMHAPQYGRTEVLENALIEIDAGGAIAALYLPGDDDYAQRKRRAGRSGRLDEFGPGRYLLPGFVDTHIHAPQWPQLGKALHLPLEQWLQRHTFPLEARYADIDFARRMYASLVDNLLANGTTTGVYYATIHQDATRALADLCAQRGQRAYIGKVAMDDREQCPDFYRDADADAALRGSRDFIDYVRALPGPAGALITPMVTPRFIPACSDALLRELGALAAAAGCRVQTHCSESDWEHEFVLRRCGASDAESLDRFGLLTRHGVLGHGTLLGGDDMTLIAERGAGVAHCPLSNVYFSNSAFPLRSALAKGVRVGLGSDLSGGPSASLFDVCRQTVNTSRLLHDGVDPALPPARRGRADSRVDFRHAFWLATAGGADLLGLDAGRFMPGQQFDAMLIDADAADGGVRRFDEVDDLDDVFQKIVYGAGRANIVGVWVAGRRVVDRELRDRRVETAPGG